MHYRSIGTTLTVERGWFDQITLLKRLKRELLEAGHTFTETFKGRRRWLWREQVDLTFATQEAAQKAEKWVENKFEH